MSDCLEIYQNFLLVHFSHVIGLTIYFSVYVAKSINPAV